MKRQYLYRFIFFLAGIYNLVFAVWLFVSAASLFGLVGTPVPFPAVLEKLMAMGILGFGFIYFYVAINDGIDIRWIIFCLLAKVTPPLLVVALIFLGEWPVSLLKMIFFNDFIWWLPFYLYLRQQRKEVYL